MDKDHSVADAFRIGASGEVWMIDAIRVWLVPPSAACSRNPADRFEKISLMGALDNPPVPGVPVCDCHALVAVATGKIGEVNGLWQVDFKNVRWSVPGDTDVLFTLQASPHTKDSCDSSLALSTASAPAGYRLHLLNKIGVPIGLEEKESSRMMNIQVWAHKSNP